MGNILRIIREQLRNLRNPLRIRFAVVLSLLYAAGKIAAQPRGPKATLSYTQRATRGGFPSLWRCMMVIGPCWSRNHVSKHGSGWTAG